MGKKFKHRWRDDDGVHRQKTFETRAHRDQFVAKLKLGQAELGGGTETFAEFARGWLETHAEVEKSETQARENKRDLELHLVPAFGGVRLKDLRDTHLLELRRVLKEEPVGRYKRKLSPKTVNHILTLARQIARAAVERQRLPSNPFAKVKNVKTGKQPYGFWTAEERDRFLRFCKQLDPAFANLVEVAAFSGLRKGELWALRRSDLDFDRRQILVAATHDHKLDKRLDRTKNGEPEHLPMTSVLVEALKDRKLLPGSAPVFDEALLRDACHRLKRRCLETGTKPIRFHDLRHTYASSLVAAGVPIYDVQKLMRHKSIAMTQRYAHHAPGHLAAAAEAICAPSVRAGATAAPAGSRQETVTR